MYSSKDGLLSQRTLKQKAWTALFSYTVIKQPQSPKSWWGKVWLAFHDFPHLMYRCIILAGVTVGLPCGNAIFSVHEEFPRLRHRLGARVPRIFGWYPWKRVPRIEWFSCYLVFLYTSNSLKRHPFENPSHIHVFGIFTCVWFIFIANVGTHTIHGF